MAEKPNLRVCFVSPAMYPLFNPLTRAVYSAAELELFELVRHLGKDKALDVNLITGDFGQEEVEFCSGVLVFREKCDRPVSGFSRFFARKNPLHKRLAAIGAPLYLSAGAGGPAVETARFCHRNRRGFVYRVTHQRECDGSYIQGNGREGKEFRWALRHADAIVCQTEEQKQLLRHTENLDALVISSAVPKEPSRADLREDVIWIGDAVEWRQPELFFRLALTLPNHPFTLLINPRDPAYFETLISKTRDIPNLGVENSVPYHEWPNYLRRAKLLVNTSRYEGFPFAFTLAFAHGIPVVSLNVDPDGILDKHQAGLCAQGSEVRLAQGVHDLLTYERQWRRMSENARRYALKHQNLDDAAQEYRRLFDLLLVAKKLKGRI